MRKKPFQPFLVHSEGIIDKVESLYTVSRTDIIDLRQDMLHAAEPDIPSETFVKFHFGVVMAVGAVVGASPAQEHGFDHPALEKRVFSVEIPVGKRKDVQIRYQGA